MALAMTLLLLLVTIPLLLGLVGSVTRSTQGARWSRAHATVDDCARAAVAEAIHGVLTSSGERAALADLEVPYDQTVQVPWAKSLVAEPAGFSVEKVRLTALRQQGYASLSTGLLQLEVELTGPRGTQKVTVLRVYTAQDQDGYVQVEVGTQDLLFERG
jgi:hypothetical protein